MLNLEIRDNILYIEGIPAFRLCDNEEKDWIAPDACTMYWNNKEFVDGWLKTCQNGSTSKALAS